MDINYFLVTAFETVDPDQVRNSFAWIIIGYFFFALFFSALRFKLTDPLTSIAATMLTTLGILGTFTGIYIGLLNFNVQDITQSVPPLLEELKVAFGTSILGLFFALLFKFISPVISPKKVANENLEREFINALRELIASVQSSEKSNQEGFESLKKALSGDEDSSVTGQLQRLRTNFSDLEKTTKEGFEAQIGEFRKFAEHMSKAFSDAIIQKLKSVIREFNEKLSEQFGEKFKQLNQAVGKLLEWQENYKEHIEKLESRFENATEAIQSTDKSLQSVAENTDRIADSIETIPEQMALFERATTQLHEQLTMLYEGLESLAEMRRAAEGAIPEIAQKIDSITDDIGKASASIYGATEETLQTLKKNADETQSMLSEAMRSVEQCIADSTSSLTEGATESRVEIVAAVKALREEFETNLSTSQEAQQIALDNFNSYVKEALDDGKEANQRMLDDISNKMEETLSNQTITQNQMLESTQNAFNETVSKSHETLENSIADLDRSMQEEIDSAVRTMAENLVGVTNKFVDQYDLLINATQQIEELQKQ